MIRTALFLGLVGAAVACALAGGVAFGQPVRAATHTGDAHATDSPSTDASGTDLGAGDLGEFKLARPSLGVAQGGALVGLARSAMARYIKARTPADAQVLGPEVSELAGSPLCAAVTLREKGVVVGRSIRTGPSLARNVISGALDVMRGPELPDRVTPAFLDSCTVEVEVLGPPRAVGNQPEPSARGQDPSKYQQDLKAFSIRLDGAINPGLTGLLLVRGDNRPDGRPNGRAYVLPSEAYEHSLTPADMPVNCRARMDREARGPLQWSIFLTMHFVGYPDGRIVYLSRGKRLMPPEMIDEKTLHDGAVSVGNFLVRHQVKQLDAETRRHGDAEKQNLNGAYVIDGALPSVVDQAWAAYAMARLAKETGDKKFAESAKAAIGYLAAFVKREENGEDSAAWLTWSGATDQEQIAATAWLEMALAEANSDKTQPQRLRTFLQRSLPGSSEEATSAPAAGVGSQSMPATSQASDGYLGREDVFIGWQALRRPLFQLLGTRRRIAEIEPADLQAALWKARAGLDHHTPVAKLVAGFGGRVLGEDGPLDEVGGVRPKGGYALTELSALLAMAAMEKGDVVIVDDPSAGARQAVALAARRFCYQMTYRSTEAYFAARPDDMVGGVRGSPISAQIRLSACAAAIEAEIAVRP